MADSTAAVDAPLADADAISSSRPDVSKGQSASTYGDSSSAGASRPGMSVNSLGNWVNGLFPPLNGSPLTGKEGKENTGSGVPGSKMGKFPMGGPPGGRKDGMSPMGGPPGGEKTGESPPIPGPKGGKEEKGESPPLIGVPGKEGKEGKEGKLGRGVELPP